MNLIAGGSLLRLPPRQTRFDTVHLHLIHSCLFIRCPSDGTFHLFFHPICFHTQSGPRTICRGLSVEFTFVLTLLYKLFLDGSGVVLDSLAFGLIFLARSHHLRLEGLDRRRIHLLVERQLPLDH